MKHGDTASMSPEGDDYLADELLPSGTLPVWVLRSEDVGDIEVLERVKETFVEEDDSVTIVGSDTGFSPTPYYWKKTHGLEGESGSRMAA